MMIYGLSGIFIVLIVLGLLSRRFGEVTSAKPYYIGFFAGAFAIGIGIAVRVFDRVTAGLTGSIIGLLLYDIAPAIGLTVALVVTWRYWSWLIAERD